MRESRGWDPLTNEAELYVPAGVVVIDAWWIGEGDPVEDFVPRVGVAMLSDRTWVAMYLLEPDHVTVCEHDHKDRPAARRCVKWDV
jgi:hypothetical protein